MSVPLVRGNTPSPPYTHTTFIVCCSNCSPEFWPLHFPDWCLNSWPHAASPTQNVNPLVIQSSIFFCFSHSRHFFWAITYLFGMALWIIFKSILQSKSLRFYFTSLVVYWTHILGCVIITITQSSLEPNCHFPCLFLHLLLSSLYLRVSRFKTLKSLLTSLLFYPSMCYQSLNSVHFLIYYLFRPFLSFHYLPGLGL